jgi:PiT family inorganic phosphate transporter
VHFDTVVEKVIIPAVASPVVCGVVALIGTFAAYKLTESRDQKSIKTGFRHGQTISASMVSLAHGTGDAQKTMGIITLVLITAGDLKQGSGPPVWVIFLAGAAIASGTYLGGWRIIRTMGKGLTDIESPQGFAAEASSTTVLLASSHLGFPLSTTQVCSGGILGAGVGRRLAQIRWSLAGKMALGWILTLPAAAAVGAVAGKAADSGNLGVVIIAIVAVVIVSGIYAASRRKPVTADNVNEVAVAPPSVKAVAAVAG